MSVLWRYRETGRAHWDKVKKLNDTDLLELKNMVDQDLGMINAKITEAKQKGACGEYSDPDWFRRINEARVLKGQLSQRIQREQARRREERRRVNRETLTNEQSLWAAMDIVLTPEQKKEVADKAKELRMKAEQQLILSKILTH